MSLKNEISLRINRWKIQFRDLPQKIKTSLWLTLLFAVLYGISVLVRRFLVPLVLFPVVFSLGTVISAVVGLWFLIKELDKKAKQVKKYLKEIDSSLSRLSKRTSNTSLKEEVRLVQSLNSKMRSQLKYLMKI